MTDTSTTTPGATGGNRGPQELIAEVRTLVTDYAKQETLQPLKQLGKWVGFGLAGAVVISLGLFLLLLGGLRALQTETGGTFDGNWSFAPYLITFVAAAAFVGLAAWAISRTSLDESGDS